MSSATPFSPNAWRPVRSFSGLETPSLYFVDAIEDSELLLIAGPSHLKQRRVLNLVVAAVAGVAVPIGLHASGRDPAHGASVLLTFITDAMGFFLFLGLASVFLL